MEYIFFSGDNNCVFCACNKSDSRPDYSYEPMTMTIICDLYFRFVRPFSKWLFIWQYEIKECCNKLKKIWQKTFWYFTKYKHSEVQLKGWIHFGKKKKVRKTLFGTVRSTTYDFFFSRKGRSILAKQWYLYGTNTISINSVKELNCNERLLNTTSSIT